MLAHAVEGMPMEVCGILGGTDGTVSAIYRVTNTDGSPDHFTMDPREQIEAMNQLHLLELEITAFYHSHPAGPDDPSTEDIRLAFYPDVFSVIVSLAEPTAPVARCFTIRGDTVKPVDIEVIRP